MLTFINTFLITTNKLTTLPIIPPSVTEFNCANSQAAPVATGAAICPGASVSLAATGCTGMGTVLKWFRATDNSVVTMPVSPTATTEYYAKCELTVGNVVCTSTASANVAVIVNSLPTASVSGTTTVCLNAPIPNVTFNGSNGKAPYTFTYQINGGSNQTIVTVGVNSSITVAVPTNNAMAFGYTLLSVKDANNCSQNQTGSAIVSVNTKPLVSINVNGQTLTEGGSYILCDIDNNTANPLQPNMTTSCIAGPVLWRTQIGAGPWSDWSANAPAGQPSNNMAYRYQAACNDATCASTVTTPITLTINYRASIPQNVSLSVDGISVSPGQSSTVCDLPGNAMNFTATCAAGEIVLYSVDGSDYTGTVPTQIADNNFHNYRVRCRKADGIISCIEQESAPMSVKIATTPLTPIVSITPTNACGTSGVFTGSSNCGSLSTIWYNASTNQALVQFPATTPNNTTSYYARCQNSDGCLGQPSNTVTFTFNATGEAPLVSSSSELVCTGSQVTLSANCPTGATVLWNNNLTQNTLTVNSATPARLSYTARCVFANGCQSIPSAPKTIIWKAFELTLINVGTSKSGTATDPTPTKSSWSSQFITPDAGPALDYSTQGNPTLFYSENLNKRAPRYWTINVETCSFGTDGSLTFDMLATPELGVPRSFNTHENNAPYFMYANRNGYTELYAQNHPAYGFYIDNGNGGNVYDEGLPKGLYKLGIRYWDQKGQGSIYPSTRQPAGNVLAYQEYWFRIQSKDGIEKGAAREALNNEQLSMNNAQWAQIMPNPVSKSMRLKVNDEMGRSVNVSMTDAAGRTLIQRSFVPKTNHHQEEFEVSHFTDGLYFLRVKTGTKHATLKVVKVE